VATLVWGGEYEAYHGGLPTLTLKDGELSVPPDTMIGIRIYWKIELTGQEPAQPMGSGQDSLEFFFWNPASFGKKLDISIPIRCRLYKETLNVGILRFEIRTKSLPVAEIPKDGSLLHLHFFRNNSRSFTCIHPRRVSSQYLLSGLARCGHCGKALIGMETKSGKFSYYVCGTLDKKGSGSCQAKYINTERFESQMSDRIVELADLESIAECVGDLRGLLKEGST
jgi:hypothetical protein